jgi:hypothetical protein
MYKPVNIMKEGMGFEPVSCIHGLIIWYKKVRFVLHFDRWGWVSKPCYKKRELFLFNNPIKRREWGLELCRET